MSTPAPERIAVVGADAPRQLLLALGVVPRRIHGSWTEPVSDDAASLLGAVDAVTMRILDEILVGHHDVAGIVVCNDSMANLRLFSVLRLLHADGTIPHAVHLLDVPPAPGPARRTFATRQFERLAGFVTSLIGGSLNIEALAEAAEVERALGAALERLRALRHAGVLSGSDLLSVMLDAGREAPAAMTDSVARLEAQLAGAGRDAAHDPRVFVTGSSHPDPTVYRLIEDAGLAIVGDDHDGGDAQWIGEAADGADVDAVLRGLAERHAQRPPRSSRAGVHERAEHLARRVRETEAQGVLSLVRTEDHAPVWDLAAQRAAVDGPFVARTRIDPGDLPGTTSAAAEELRAALESRTR